MHLSSGVEDGCEPSLHAAFFCYCFMRYVNRSHTVTSSRVSNNVNSTLSHDPVGRAHLLPGEVIIVAQKTTPHLNLGGHMHSTHTPIVHLMPTRACCGSRQNVSNRVFTMHHFSTHPPRYFVHGEVLSVHHACRHPRMKLPTLQTTAAIVI